MNNTTQELQNTVQMKTELEIQPNEITEKPLISFCLFAYNQERFIKEAVQGALSQTYSPLEIILSDDCSTDSTFEIITELIKDYNGSHSIKINRNSQNLGIGSHINKIMEIASGILIVAAAGDDISLPNRTEELYNEWISNKCFKGVIYSAFQQIDEDNNIINEINNPTLNFINDKSNIIPYVAPNIIGATAMWHRFIFDFFGKLYSDVVNEDMCIAYRAYLVDEGTRFSNNILLRRRISSNNISSRDSNSFKNLDDFKEFKRKQYKNILSTINQMEKDFKFYSLQKFGKNIDPNIILKNIKIQRIIHQSYFALNSDISPIKKVISSLKCFKYKESFKTGIKCILLISVPFYYNRGLKIQLQHWNNEIV